MCDSASYKKRVGRDFSFRFVNYDDLLVCKIGAKNMPDIYVRSIQLNEF